MAFPHKHLIDISEYSADDIMLLMKTAESFKEVKIGRASCRERVWYLV